MLTPGVTLSVVHVQEKERQINRLRDACRQRNTDRQEETDRLREAKQGEVQFMH